MSEQITIGFDELSAMLAGDAIHLDEDEHEVIENSDDSVTIIVDPESATIVEDGDFVGVGVSLSEDIYLRLACFGHDNLSEGDKRILMFLLDKVKQSVRNFINVGKIPDGLHYQVVDAVCAEFLKVKYALGKINVEFASTPVASIKEGDTTVTYGTTSTTLSPQKIFLTILDSMGLSKSEMCRYRRLVW